MTSKIKDIDALKSDPGTYALILKCSSESEIFAGRRLRIQLTPGYYIYVGSALGPGGVKARLRRHLKTEKRRHWHVDYLLDFVRPVAVLCIYGRERIEHRWAEIFLGMKEIVPVSGFGSSDCGCLSHLFWSAVFPAGVLAFSLWQKKIRLDILPN